MSKTDKNFAELVKKFKDKWVAVSEDYGRVFASANSLDKVMKKIDNKKRVKIFKVIPLDLIYSPVQL